MDSNPARRGFIPYPTNRVVGTIEHAKDADSAVTALVEAGFDGSPSTCFAGTKIWAASTRPAQNMEYWSGCNEHSFAWEVQSKSTST